MIALLSTAERTGDFADSNSYVLNRHIFAYMTVKKLIGDIVLELGCGNGYGMKLLSNYCKHYIGVDKFLSTKTILNGNTAIFKSQLPNLNNIGNDSYDTIICFQVIEHIKNDKHLLEEMKRVLKPGGNLFLTTPNKNKSLTRNPFHIREYTVDSMKEVIGTTFEQFEIMGIYGDRDVMAYYEKNKESVQRISNWDIFDLQNKLPRFLLKLPYNILNNINRLQLLKNNTVITNNINYHNFYLDKVSDTCLDFFVTAAK